MLDDRHYFIGICSISGQDYVPYLNRYVFDWLADNFARGKDYSFETNVNSYAIEPETEKVGILFSNEENAMAFKLMWM